MLIIGLAYLMNYSGLAYTLAKQLLRPGIFLSCSHPSSAGWR